jgi:hypothetical protein
MEIAMCFRADFYLGRGKRALWLGSLREHGAPVHLRYALKRCNDQRAFYAAALELVTSIPDGVPREQGWPWSYPDSSQTDYTYAFDDGQLFVSCYGSPFVPVSALNLNSLLDDYDFDDAYGDEPIFPLMPQAGLMAVTDVA